MMQFELTENHITLLTNSFIGWQDAEYGALAVDPKRPYGNSSVEYDIIELLDLEDHEEDFARQVHQETLTALQIILQTRQFKTGTYIHSGYFEGKWQLKEE